MFHQTWIKLNKCWTRLFSASDVCNSSLTQDVKFDWAGLADKYNPHGSAPSHDSRKRTRDVRDDRDAKRDSTLTRKIIRTDDRSRIDSRSHRISSPTYKERKYVASALNEYLDAYDNQPKNYLEEKTKIYPPPKVYESKPVSYVENEHRKIDIQPTCIEDKPKVPRIRDICPKKRYNELNPLMNSMVEDEIENLMVNVWQTFMSDDTPVDAEKYVLNVMRKDVVGELRNTMGLNVTKRLLNLSNESSQRGFLVKIQMSDFESSHDLYEFYKRYKIDNVRNLQKRTYSGCVFNWTQLDELCSAKNLTCGNSKVTVKVLYNFLRCPPMLKTVYDGSHKSKVTTTFIKDTVRSKDAKKEETKKTISKDKATVKKADKTALKKTDTTESPTNMPPKYADKKRATKPSQTANVQKETKQNSAKTNTRTTQTTVLKDGRKGEENKQKSQTVAKATQKTATKEPSRTVAKEPPKTVAKEPSKTLVKEPPKTVAKEPPKTVAKEPPKTVAKEPPKTVAKEPPKTVAKEPPKTVAKEPPKTVAKEPAKTTNKQTPKPTAKQPAKLVANVSTKPITKETKPVAGKKETFVKPKSPTKKAVDAKAKKDSDDFEELDDHDILALLSSGIVLDACSGSDDD